MVYEVKEYPQLLREECDKGFVILVSHQTVREHSITLVDPESGHGNSCVLVVLVGSKETLEDLIVRGWLNEGEEREFILQARRGNERQMV